MDMLPMYILKQMKKKYPQVFDRMDSLRDQARDIYWPRERVWLPVSGALAVMDTYHGWDIRQSKPYQDSLLIEALAGWRQAKNIYEIAAPLAAALRHQAQAAPAEVGVDLVRLPAYTVYIRLPKQMPDDEDGAFIWWEYDDETGYELRVLPVKDNGRASRFLYLPVGNEPARSLSDCLQAVAREGEQNLTKAGYGAVAVGALARESKVMQDTLNVYLHVLLYLSAVNADIRPKRPAPRKDRAGRRPVRDIPAEVREMDVGAAVSVHLRTLRQTAGRTGTDTAGRTPGTERKAPAMHLRRAHWHTYYTGPRSVPLPERKRELKWLPPVIVNQETTADTVTQITVK